MSAQDTSSDLRVPASNWLAGVIFEPPFRIDALLGEAAARFKTNGLKVGGVLQTYNDVPGCQGNDLRLQAIDAAWELPIMEQRGSFARGCRLDYAAMADASAWIDAALDSAPDLVVLNRFGRAESEGNGLRGILQRCAESETPTLIAVRKDYQPAWAAFHGGLGDDLPCNLNAIVNWYDCLPNRTAEQALAAQG